MWLSERLRAAGFGRRIRLGTAALSMTLLAACQVAPVYGPTPAGNSAVSSELAAIYIEEVDDRVAQEVRNRLIFSFTGGAGQTSTPRYDMRLTTTSTGGVQALTRDQIKPLVAVQVAVTYDVIERSTNRQIARGTARASANYTQLNQAFANDRARRDAETRAALSAADDIRLRIAAIFAGAQ